MAFARTLIVAVALMAMTAPLQSTLASTESKPVQQADFLFVQSARGMSYDKAGGKLTLHDVSPVTLFFSDPPNADISILEGDNLRQVVAELRSPMLSGHDLTYTVKVLQGDMPAKGGHLPLTATGSRVQPT